MQNESCLSAVFPRFRTWAAAVLISAGLFWATALAAAAQTPSKGQVILEADFESADSAAAPASGQRYEAGWQSPRALCVESLAGAGGSSPSVRLRLPAETLRGCTATRLGDGQSGWRQRQTQSLERDQVHAGHRDAGPQTVAAGGLGYGHL